MVQRQMLIVGIAKLESRERLGPPERCVHTMHQADHQSLKSSGSSAAAVKYRRNQRKDIEKGEMAAVLEQEIADVQRVAAQSVACRRRANCYVAGLRVLIMRLMTSSIPACILSILFVTV